MRLFMTDRPFYLRRQALPPLVHLTQNVLRGGWMYIMYDGHPFVFMSHTCLHKVFFSAWSVSAMIATAVYMGGVGSQKPCTLYYQAFQEYNRFCQDTLNYGWFLLISNVLIIAIKGYHIYKLRAMEKWPQTIIVFLAWALTIATTIMVTVLYFGIRVSVTTIQSQKPSSMSDYITRNDLTLQAALNCGWILCILYFLLGLYESFKLRLLKNSSNTIPSMASIPSKV
jgi:hypothetical protein